VAPTQAEIRRLTDALRLTTPVIALYDGAAEEDFAPVIRVRGRACCFAYYPRWVKGETLAIPKGRGSFTDLDAGCPGAQAAFGFTRQYPPFMAHFLTDGEGAPMGEGLKAEPRLAQEFLDRSRPVKPASDVVLLGPLRADRWEKVRTVTFFADPDRLSALMTLAAFWTSDPDAVYAPFSSGCGLMWRELANRPEKKAIIGCTDIAMRRYLPPEILCLTVPAAHFEKMVRFPDGCFLTKDWWGELLRARGLA
jgi:hypothetical protein